MTFVTDSARYNVDVCIKFSVMKTNIGKIDRFIRVLMAVVIAVLFSSGMISGAWSVVLLVIAVAFVITSFTGFCPLYWPFGISSVSRKSKVA